jgi:hypothetical protein
VKLLTPRCPECGALARGTLENISACAEMTLSDDGQAEFTGHTAVFWDGQMTERDPGNDHIIFLCHEGHEWTSEVHDEADSLEARP